MALDSFTIELVSKASAELFLDNTLRSFTNLLPDRLNLEVQWEFAISEVSNHQIIKLLQSTSSRFLFKKTSKSPDFYFLEPGRNPSITNIVESMKNLIQQRHDHNDSCIPLKVPRRMQKIDNFRANHRSGPALLLTNWDVFSEKLLAMKLE